MDWKQIVAQGETKNTDFKAACSWDGDDRIKLAKDIAAMANTRDGGSLIVGVDDDQNGAPRLTGLSVEQLGSFDVTKIGEYVNSRFEPNIRLRVEKPLIDGHALAIIVVGEFEEQPHICVKEGTANGKVQFLPGHLLIRSSAAQTKVAGAEELRELLSRAMSRRGDHLLEQIKRIVTGVPTPTRKKEAQELFQSDLNEWDEIIAGISQQSPHGGWSFVTMPTQKTSGPFSHDLLRTAMGRASVELRGWGFPPVPASEVANRTASISGDAKLGSFVEHWRLFKDAFFGDFRSFWEDSLWLKNGVPGSELSFVNVTYSVAEFVLFSKRLLSELSYEGEAVLQVRLLGCSGRKLVSKEPNRTLYGDKKSVENEIVTGRTVHTTELAAGWEERAADMVQEIFALFNWSNADRGMILGDIARLRDRRA